MVISSFIVPANIKLSQTSLVCQNPGLVIRGVSSKKKSICPCCHKPSKSIHSRYERTFSDLPVSGKGVKVVVESRKFFCRNRKCRRKIFTERFDCEITPYGRSFNRSVHLIRKLGLELGGNKGSAICKAIGFPVSPSSVLRNVKQIQLPETIKTSGTIGVDDWAYKKGRNYGTIIVDLENRKVIDLLPDREAGTLAHWLESHPEIRTVSRDRASAYALGIRTGAPRAVQVADRFHLLVNLRDAFQNSLRKHFKVIKDSFQEFSAENEVTQDGKENPNNNQVSDYKSSGTEKTEIRGQDTNSVFSGNVGLERQYKFQKSKELHKKATASKPSPTNWVRAERQSESILQLKS
ncbi:ISL3 family transposase [Negadavirga shengliensis]|uniref:ISL3 family transposase n=1 Tax=Negadavirga shengliensis TaxID=1389218 RepID=A0ABV9T1U8_9BACT